MMTCPLAEGPAVRVMLVYSSRGALFIQSRQCLTRDGAVIGLNGLWDALAQLTHAAGTSLQAGATHKMTLPASTCPTLKAFARISVMIPKAVPAPLQAHQSSSCSCFASSDRLGLLL